MRICNFNPTPHTVCSHTYLFLYVHAARVFTEEEGGRVRGRTPGQILCRLLPFAESQFGLGSRVRQLPTPLGTDCATPRGEPFANNGICESSGWTLSLTFLEHGTEHSVGEGGREREKEEVVI